MLLVADDPLHSPDELSRIYELKKKEQKALVEK